MKGEIFSYINSTMQSHPVVLDNIYLIHLSTEKQKEDENHTTKSSQSR